MKAAMRDMHKQCSMWNVHVYSHDYLKSYYSVGYSVHVH